MLSGFLGYIYLNRSTDTSKTLYLPILYLFMPQFDFSDKHSMGYIFTFNYSKIKAGSFDGLLKRWNTEMALEESYTTIGGWVVAMTKAFEYLNEDIQPLLDQVSISPDEFLNPDYRVSAKKINQLLELASKQVNDPCFAVSIADYVHPSTFSVLGYSMLASDTMKEVLQRLSRYKKIVSNTCDLKAEETNTGFQLTMYVQKDVQDEFVLSEQSTLAFLSTIMKFLRGLSKENYSPLKVSFTASRPAYHDQLAQYFNCEISYGAEQTFILFDKDSVEKKLPTGNIHVTQLHDKVLLDFMTKLDESDLVSRVQSKIMDSITLGLPHQEDIAKSLNMSLRNLQRKLGEKGTHFKDILDETRHNLAIQYVKQPNLSLGEISYLLGFSSVTNFSRAFKRWTSEAPGQYRINNALAK